MGIFRRVAELLGLGKDDQNPNELENKQDPDDGSDHHPQHSSSMRHSGLPRKGFGVPVQVVLDRPRHPPLLLPCTSGDGGVQGLTWYAKRLKVDEDGDVADEFINEVPADTLAATVTEAHHKPLSKFTMKHNAQPAKVGDQVLLPDGRVQHSIEHQGVLSWV